MATTAKNPTAAPDSGVGQRKNNVIDLDERRRLFTQAITVFVGQQNLVKAMKQEELAQLEGIQRHLALSKSLLPNLIRICRRNPRADTRLAVLTLITLLCDNNEGVCRLSVLRMAELLSRKDDNVRKAINDLEANGELFVNRVHGLPNSYWPMVPVEVSTMNPAMTWFVDALSTKPAPRGRPATQPSAKCPPAIGGPFENRPENLPRETSKSPPAKADSISLNDIATKKEGALARSTPTDDLKLNEEAAESAARARPMRKVKAHGGDIERAVERYNEAANKHDFSPCETRTGARQRRLAQRLEEIGGLENFCRALTAIPKNDWLMGRVKNPSRTPFKLNIDSLMQTGGKSGDVLANLLDEALAVERAQCERFEVDWFIAFGNHMLGDNWQPPQWVADFPAPWADGQPVTNEAARAWVRECRPWSDLVDRYVSGGDCEEEFKRIRHEMFDTGERERLSASRREALERKYQADAEQRKQAALEREERGLEREREEGEAVRRKEEASKTFWQELNSRPPPVVSDELKRFLFKSAN